MKFSAKGLDHRAYVKKLRGIRGTYGAGSAEVKQYRRSAGTTIKPKAPKPSGPSTPSSPKPTSTRTRRLPPEVQSALTLKYGPQENDLASQARVSDLAQQRIPAFFDQYRQQLQQINQAQQAGYQQAQNEIAQMTASTQGAQPQDPNAANDAAIRGATVDPALAQRAEAAAQQRGIGASVFGGLLSTQKAALGAYGQGQLGVATQEQGRQSSLESARGRQMAQKRSELTAQKGADTVQLIQQLKEAAHKAQLEDIAFNNTQIKTADQLKNSARNRAKSRADQRNSRANRILQSKKFGSAEEKDRFERRNHLGPYKPPSSGKGSGKDGKPAYTRLQRSSAREDLSGAIDLAQHTTKGGDQRSAYDFLTQAKHVKPSIARAAVEYVFSGNISDKTRRTLYGRYGIHGPKNTVKR
jgi:hypothetical protein